jgi:FKBP-type peptidyl-prolyl cis-trans isomerase FkpA
MKTEIKMKYLILSAIVLVSFGSCNNFKVYEQQEADEIATYIGANPSRNFEKKTSGLYYSETTIGTGIQPLKHDTVYIFYSVMSLDGTQWFSNFGSSDTTRFPVMEGFVIKGLDEGITYMKTGGRAFFLIPSKLAYGRSGYEYYDGSGNTISISGFTPLLFDVSLVRVKLSDIRK